jgi:hypothetical protein
MDVSRRGVPRLYRRIPELSSPNYFFLDLYDTYPHNRCVGWFEISTSPRFRNIFCKKRDCGYTNSHLHSLKKRKNDYVHSDVAALLYVFSRRVHTSYRQQGSVPYRRRVSSTNRRNGDRYTPSFPVFDHCWHPLCVRWW